MNDGQGHIWPSLFQLCSTPKLPQSLRFMQQSDLLAIWKKLMFLQLNLSGERPWASYRVGTRSQATPASYSWVGGSTRRTMCDTSAIAPFKRDKGLSWGTDASWKPVHLMDCANNALLELVILRRNFITGSTLSWASGSALGLGSFVDVGLPL